MGNCEVTGKAIVGNRTVYLVRDNVYITKYSRADLLNRLLRGSKLDNVELTPTKKSFRVKKGMTEIPDLTEIYRQNNKRIESAAKVRQDTLKMLGFPKGIVTRDIAQTVIQRKYNGYKYVELAVGDYKSCYLILNAFGENRNLLIIPSDVDILDTQDKRYKAELPLLSSMLSKLTGSLMVIGGSGLKNIAAMFDGCFNLSEIDLRGFDTRNVHMMCGLFARCFSLISVDVSGLDTSNVYDMSSLFALCENLKEIRGLTNFVTTFATSIGAMFSRCSSLTNLDLSSFHTLNVINMMNMFKYCSSLTSINFGEAFTMARVMDATCMFAHCSSLIEVDLHMCQFAKGMKVLYMFTDCKNLRVVNIMGFEPIIPSDEEIKAGRVPANATFPMDIYSMFEGCPGNVKIKSLSVVHDVLNRFRN